MNYVLSGKTYFTTPKDDSKDRIEIEIGDSKQPDIFYPQLKIMRWGNEVNCSIRLKTTETATPSKVGENITWSTDKIGANFYAITEGEGGYEFEVILKEKPLTNELEFTLNTKGLDFFYQPPLTEEYKIGDKEGKIAQVTETDCFTIDGKVTVHRPEKVVGSYAVYYKNCPMNFVGGKEYKAGIAFNIYRPRIEDSVGNWVWGELNIDEVNNLLTVTIPQSFLDSAVYPIKHAAGLEFGYHTVGGTANDMGGNCLTTRAQSTPASNGTLNSISVYGKIQSNTPDQCPALYSSVTSAPSARLAHVESGGTAYGASDAWVTTNISYASIVAGTTYFLGWLSNEGVGAWNYYNAGVAGDFQYFSYSDWADPAGTPLGTASQKYSIYATYTAGGGGPSIVGWKTLLGVGQGIFLFFLKQLTKFI